MSRPLAQLLPIALAFAGCKKAPDEQRVTELVRAAIEAANQKHAGEVVENAIERFEGPHGADLRESRRLLTGLFLREGWVRVFERDLEVKVDGDRATAKLDAVLARGKPVEKLEDLIPTNATELVFTVDLVRVDGDWKFAKARYQRKRR